MKNKGMQEQDTVIEKRLEKVEVRVCMEEDMW